MVVIIFKQYKGVKHSLTKITNNLKGYLALQARAGATALQIFDTWAGLLSPDLHRKFVLPHLKELTAFVKEELKLPVTLFNQNLAGIMDQYIECEPSCISVDWKLDILKVRELVPKSIALQGNLQPELLDVNDSLKSLSRKVFRWLCKNHYYQLRPQTGYII